MGVEGGNISSAMKDVEDIMDKLVLGFEKQLDALFDSEALDVTTDVSVLENMMLISLQKTTALDTSTDIPRKTFQYSVRDLMTRKRSNSAKPYSCFRDSKVCQPSNG